MAETGKNIEQAAALLKAGKLVAIPTETVYGLAANALNEQAVLKIFEAKNRPFFDPLIIHVHSMEAATQYAVFDDERLQQLARRFWPGPLTLLLPKKEIIPAIVTSGLQQVAVRVPDHVITLKLLAALNLPLAAPSANPFGYVSPTEPAHVEKQLGKKVDYILDGGPSAVGLESTIAGVENGRVVIYRLGGLPIEVIEKEIGSVELRLNQSSNPVAPGQLKSHYAPKKPLFIGDINELIKSNVGKKIALLYFGDKKHTGNNVLMLNLSQKESLEEAALNLFRFLRLADESDADIVICEKLPDVGLGRAINDRLTRASVS
ncbi:MAG: L-threonylcarbamoyladenylate synthase [Bacteroidota bacterium]